MQEVYNRVNELALDAVVTLTDTKKKIIDLFTFSEESQKNPKTIIVTNNSNAKIYFSDRISATTANAGGIIPGGNQREIPLYDLRHSPYFFTDGSNVNMRIEVWR